MPKPDFPSPSVIWIGGPPGAGKTTVASILARRHGLRLYSADTRTWRHRDRAIAAGSRAAIRWEALEPAARRTQPDDELIAMSLHRERGAMVVEDVARLPRVPLVIAEGSVIRPQDLPSDARAVWLLPGPAMQARLLREREGEANRLYTLLLNVVAQEIAAARAPVVEVRRVAETVVAVEAFFARELAAGLLATGVDERRALLREANLDVVNQVRGFHARPWASGDPESVVRGFICECGRADCTAFVATRVARAAAAPVIAHGHAVGREVR